jgi:uncharacterized protein (DUF2235 family)
MRREELLEETPRIRFLGLFDTVFSTADLNAALSFRQARTVHLGNMAEDFFELPDNIDHSYHAMAMHVRKPGFTLTRFKNAYEVWFPGVHGDIGGGENDRCVTTTSLQWLVAKARDHDIDVDPTDTLDGFKPTLPEIAHRKIHLYRKIRTGDRIHECAEQLSLGVDVGKLAIEQLSAD